MVYQKSNRIRYSYNGISFTKHNFCEILSRIIILHYICSPSSIPLFSWNNQMKMNFNSNDVSTTKNKPNSYRILCRNWNFHSIRLIVKIIIEAKFQFELVYLFFRSIAWSNIIISNSSIFIVSIHICNVCSAPLP